ncbi:MAG: hypothetical protein ACPG43_09300 [Alcanivoracaceae bacterium]
MSGLWGFLALVVLALAGTLAVQRLHRLRQPRWTPGRVASLLDGWCNDDIDQSGWRALEQARLADPALEAIRRQAVWATYLGSACVAGCGTPQMRLTAQGRILFAQLRDRCIALGETHRRE